MAWWRSKGGLEVVPSGSMLAWWWFSGSSVVVQQFEKEKLKLKK
jgi:hypothetical protein